MTQSRRISVIAGSLVLLAAAVNANMARAASSADAVYRQIKGLETQFPLPTPYAEAVVGTFDARTGEFSGATSIDEIMEVGGKPRREKIPGVVDVNAVNAWLVFRVRNAQGPLSVTANGQTAVAAAGADSVTIDVGPVSRVSWQLRSGSRSFGDELIIRRPMIIGAGAFTIPALPVAVIYAPPQGSTQQNQTLYTTATWIGTTTRTSIEREQSTTRINASWADSKAIASTMAGLLGKANKAVGGILNQMISGLGDISSSETTGTRVTSSQALEVLVTESASVSTPPGAEPGVGDMLYYLKNARVVWLAVNGQLTLGLLGYDSQAFHSVRNLQQGGFGIDADTASALLSIDPFVQQGANAALNEPRFYKLQGAYEGSDTPPEGHRYEFEHRITQSDVTATAKFNVRTKETRSGWLSFLGMAPGSDQTVKMTTTHSSSQEQEVGSMVRTTVKFVAPGQEIYSVDAFYDRVFGTFAFKQRPLSKGERINGAVFAIGPNSAPLANQLVTLRQGDQLISTHTNAQGRYTFRSASIKPGLATLLVGNQPVRTVQIAAGPLRDVELRVTAATPVTPTAPAPKPATTRSMSDGVASTAIVPAQTLATTGCIVSGELVGQRHLVRQVLLHAGGRQVAAVQPDATGKFHFAPVSPGKYRVAPESGGKAVLKSTPATINLTCRASEPLSVRFEIAGLSAG